MGFPPMHLTPDILFTNKWTLTIDKVDNTAHDQSDVEIPPSGTPTNTHMLDWSANEKQGNSSMLRVMVAAARITVVTGQDNIYQRVQEQMHINQERTDPYPA
jgi:hypothetical protein